jgi:diacylglycerol kinase family enzyme
LRVRIRLDDRPPMPRRPRSVIVGNVGRLQGGIRLLTEAEPDDGKLDVAILSPGNLGHWVSLGIGVLLHRPRKPLMEIYAAERVEVVSDRTQPRQLDGDLIDPGRTLKIGLRRRALLLCVPQPDGDPDLAYDASAAERAAEPVRAAAEEAR